MSKYDLVNIKYGEDARNTLKTGINKFTRVVSYTYGPLVIILVIQGKNVAIDKDHNPIITKDGVTVAKHTRLSKREENIGVRLLSSAAGSTNKFAGDGTTTSCVLAGEIVR